MTAAMAVEGPDLPAFESFYEDSTPRLVLFLRHHGASWAEAADCVQDAMVSALQSWSTIEQPYAWCRRVALRYWIRCARRSRRESSSDDLEGKGAPLLSPSADTEAVEQQLEVLGMLRKLPPRQRQVMAWTFDGATPAEIAAELGMDPQTVRSNLRKARAALRGEIDAAADARAHVLRQDVPRHLQVKLPLPLRRPAHHVCDECCEESLSAALRGVSGMLLFIGGPAAGKSYYLTKVVTAALEGRFDAGIPQPPGPDTAGSEQDGEVDS